MNNWIGPIVKQLGNYAMHVLHNFFGFNITTAFCLGRSSLHFLILISSMARPIYHSSRCGKKLFITYCLNNSLSLFLLSSCTGWWFERVTSCRYEAASSRSRSRHWGRRRSKESRPKTSWNSYARKFSYLGEFKNKDQKLSELCILQTANIEQFRKHN